MSKKSTSQKCQTEGCRKSGGMRSEKFRHQAFGKAEPVRARRRGRLAKTDDRLPWGVGVPIIMVMTMGVVGSLWFGWKIDKGLGELSRNRQGLAIEAEMNQELVAKRDSLLARENIIRKAAVFGLFPPTDKQLRKP